MGMTEKVIASFQRRRVPVLIGQPGIGKTAFAVDLATRVGGKATVICFSHKDPVDVHGLPVLSKEPVDVGGVPMMRVEMAPPDWATDAINSDAPTVLVFDELSCVPPGTAAPVLSILADRVVGQLALDPTKVLMMACMNEAKDAAGGWELTPPMANRLTHLQYKVDPLQWAEQFPTYWGRSPELGFRPSGYSDEQWQERRSQLSAAWATARTEVAAYIRSKIDALNRMPKDRTEAGGAWASCRSWDFVSRTRALRLLNELSDRDHEELIAGDIGSHAAAEFGSWRSTVGLVDVGALFANPNSFSLPPSVDSQYYLVSSLPAHVGNSLQIARDRAGAAKLGEKVTRELVAKWRTAWELIGRFVKAGGPKDMAALAARQLLEDRCRPDSSKVRAELPEEIDLFPDLLIKAGLRPPMKGK